MKSGSSEFFNNIVLSAKALHFLTANTALLNTDVKKAVCFGVSNVVIVTKKGK